MRWKNVFFLRHWGTCECSRSRTLSLYMRNCIPKRNTAHHYHTKIENPGFCNEPIFGVLKKNHGYIIDILVRDGQAERCRPMAVADAATKAGLSRKEKICWGSAQVRCQGDERFIRTWQNTICTGMRILPVGKRPRKVMSLPDEVAKAVAMCLTTGGHGCAGGRQCAELHGVLQESGLE